ncbi:hypothetical protein [Aestuariivita boseongensis]|uniref:hypothetical protein n=1 Tax=Aestuariivita boseongensis TaxID=1470562 RepID=UPI0012FCC48C|nr:hypothetical protein [Aestuariivita boseongensis]
MSDRLDAIEISVARLRQKLATLWEEAQAPSTAGSLKHIYDALAELLQAIEDEYDILGALRDELNEAPARLLASWRVTEREILATEARALKEDLDTLFQAARRAHVDLAGALIEMR